MARALRPGDRVRLTGKFLKNTGQRAGGEGRKRWTLVECSCGLCHTGRFVAVDEPSEFAEPGEPRECPCGINEPDPYYDVDTANLEAEHPCPDCHGTGRLGEEGAEPDVAVFEEPMGSGEWYWRRVGLWDGQHGPYPTEADALTAARKAHREES